MDKNINNIKPRTWRPNLNDITDKVKMVQELAKKHAKPVMAKIQPGIIGVGKVGLGSHWLAKFSQTNKVTLVQPIPLLTKAQQKNRLSNIIRDCPANRVVVIEDFNKLITSGHSKFLLPKYHHKLIMHILKRQR